MGFGQSNFLLWAAAVSRCGGLLWGASVPSRQNLEQRVKLGQDCVLDRRLMLDRGMLDREVLDRGLFGALLRYGNRVHL